MNTKLCKLNLTAGNKTNRLLKSLTVASAIMLAVWPAVSSRADFTPSGTPVSLASLLSGGSFSSGDKLFTNWEYNSLNISANSITLTPGFDEFGFGFRITSTEFSAVAGTMKDGLLFWTATSLGTPITDVHMRFDGNADGGLTTVVEQVRNSNGIIGQFAVYNPPAFMSDTFLLDTPQQQLLLNKDFFLIGLTGIASIDYIDQTFSQEGGGGPGGGEAIPEPNTATLFTVGVGVFGLMVWRNRKPSAS